MDSSKQLRLAATVMTIVAVVQVFACTLGGSWVSATHAVTAAWFAWVAERIAAHGSTS